MTKTTKAVAMLGMVAALGVAALPLSSYAAVPVPEEGISHNVTVKLNVAEELNFKIDDGDDNKEVTLTNATASTSPVGLYTQAGSFKLTVDTTVAKGYTLSVVGATEGDTANALKSKNDGSQAKIVSTGITGGTSGTSSWGFQKSDSASFSGNDYTAIPATNGTEVKKTDKASKDDVYVRFGAYVAAGQESGDYEGVAKFTATANPAS